MKSFFKITTILLATAAVACAPQSRSKSESKEGEKPPEPAQAEPAKKAETETPAKPEQTNTKITPEQAGPTKQPAPIKPTEPAKQSGSKKDEQTKAPVQPKASKKETAPAQEPTASKKPAPLSEQQKAEFFNALASTQNLIHAVGAVTTGGTTKGKAAEIAATLSSCKVNVGKLDETAVLGKTSDSATASTDGSTCPVESKITVSRERLIESADGSARMNDTRVLQQQYKVSSKSVNSLGVKTGARKSVETKVVVSNSTTKVATAKATENSDAVWTLSSGRQVSETSSLVVTYTTDGTKSELSNEGTLELVFPSFKGQLKVISATDVSGKTTFKMYLNGEEINNTDAKTAAVKSFTNSYSQIFSR
jgi:hypothetical protein